MAQFKKDISIPVDLGEAPHLGSLKVGDELELKYELVAPQQDASKASNDTPVALAAPQEEAGQDASNASNAVPVAVAAPQEEAGQDASNASNAVPVAVAAPQEEAGQDASNASNAVPVAVAAPQEEAGQDASNASNAVPVAVAAPQEEAGLDASNASNAVLLAVAVPQEDARIPTGNLEAATLATAIPADDDDTAGATLAAPKQDAGPPTGTYAATPSKKAASLELYRLKLPGCCRWEVQPPRRTPTNIMYHPSATVKITVRSIKRNAEGNTCNVLQHTQCRRALQPAWHCSTVCER
eukprot:gene1043-3910_t